MKMNYNYSERIERWGLILIELIIQTCTLIDSVSILLTVLYLRESRFKTKITRKQFWQKEAIKPATERILEALWILLKSYHSSRKWRNRVLLTEFLLA